MPLPGPPQVYDPRQHAVPATAAPRGPGAFVTLRPWLRRTFLVGLALLALAGWRKGTLPAPQAILPELWQVPVQEATAREPFDFRYKGHACRVRPVASYELWGLVVSHNDIHSVADTYHDATSVDTRDLCVVWGGTLRHSDYRLAKYRSGPFTCYVSWREPLPELAMENIGNNHLITDSAAVRDAIARVRVGDQVHVKGLLVDYQMDDWEGFWRRTSTVRTDSGCEVVYVEDLEILRRGTPFWYALWRLGWILVVAAPLAWLVLFVRQAGRNPVRLGEL